MPTYPPVGPGRWPGDVTSGTTLADEPATRDFWYYVAFVEDPCGNVSAVSNMTGGTLNYHLGDVMRGHVLTCGNVSRVELTTGTLNYHLGDVMAAPVLRGDNVVDISDISFLGGHYGVASGNGLYLACLDVGPTTNHSVNARPTTDNKINFEDLMMFAINYGTVSASTTQPVAAVASDAVWVEGPAKVVAGQTFTVSLRLSGSGDAAGPVGAAGLGPRDRGAGLGGGGRAGDVAGRAWC